MKNYHFRVLEAVGPSARNIERKCVLLQKTRSQSTAWLTFQMHTCYTRHGYTVTNIHCALFAQTTVLANTRHARVAEKRTQRKKNMAQRFGFPVFSSSYCSFRCTFNTVPFNHPAWNCVSLFAMLMIRVYFNSRRKKR